MQTGLPIILAHGICPFDKVIRPFSNIDNTQDDRFHYFRFIRNTLIEQGFTAFHARVSWAASLERRARDLRGELLRITDNFTLWPAVHIIAHSMGGLDARWMLYKYRMQDRVRSLTTIGTPHHGSSFADHRIRRFGFLIGLAGCIGLHLEGLRDLTRERCRRLNKRLETFENHCGVSFRTVAGVESASRCFFYLRHSNRIIRRIEGPNDGLVSLHSARWKDAYFLEKVRADHLGLIGWRDPLKPGGPGRKAFEHEIQHLYLRLAGSLADG